MADMVPQRTRPAGVKAARNGGFRGETNQFVERRARCPARAIVIASAAKQSSLLRMNYGLLRRCAPRNDELGLAGVEPMKRHKFVCRDKFAANSRTNLIRAAT